jgi:hypothetical protein
MEPSELIPLGRLLSPEDRSRFSAEALRLFALVWKNMNRTKKQQFFMTDVQSSIHARILLGNVASARQELHDAEVFHIKQIDQMRGSDTEPVFVFQFCEPTD